MSSSELSKMFQAWAMDHPLEEKVEIKDKWWEFTECIEENFSETAGEKILGYVLDLYDLVEQRAFIAGFRQAFLLWLEICKS